MLSYFIYYRVARGQEAPARAQARRLQAKLSESAGVHSRLMTKRGEPNLWMEVYEAVLDPTGFERALETAVQELDLHQWLAPGSRRHMECFED
ncbi:MAG TPA: DUF4936 family protein [Burkholderiales bacterium]|nr:DUF4936 family protein [Burkholderiales bacterium]